MKIFAVFGIAIVCCLGCDANDGSSSSTANHAQQYERNTETKHQLTDIGDPDGKKRELHGVKISGSALTDEHIAAIMALTDDKNPSKANRYLIRDIEHTGPNAATNTWQTGHAQFHQTLRFENGKWKIHEEVGGFGGW